MLQGGGPEAPSASQAEFSGHLDITALGGAGFASQRTADDVPGWDVSGYDVLVLDVARADARKYTLTLKDEVLPRRPDGRDQSTVSWEYDFVVGAGEDAAAGASPGSSTAGSARVVIPFQDFQPTYRGKSKPDADPLDLKNVKRISFMMRRSVLSARVPMGFGIYALARVTLGEPANMRHHPSFFGDQEGDFSIVFNSVAVEKKDKSRDDSIDSVAAAKLVQDEQQLEQQHRDSGASKGSSTLSSWFGRLCGWGR